LDDKSCTRTDNRVGSWWQVDIGATYEIRKVVITNRGDCCGKLNQTDVCQHTTVSKHSIYVITNSATRKHFVFL